MNTVGKINKWELLRYIMKHQVDGIIFDKFSILLKRIAKELFDLDLDKDISEKKAIAEQAYENLDPIIKKYLLGLQWGENDSKRKVKVINNITTNLYSDNEVLENIVEAILSNNISCLDARYSITTEIDNYISCMEVKNYDQLVEELENRFNAEAIENSLYKNLKVEIKRRLKDSTTNVEEIAVEASPVG